MIDLRSDTVTMPSKEMKQFMLNAPLGDDVYGDDPSVNTLENQASDLFGKEDSVFIPSGTMANLIAVLSHCNRGDEILLGNKSHIFVYEAGGTSVFGGIHSHQLHNNNDGTINVDDIENGIRPSTDNHYPTSKLICLENTHNLCFGAPIKENYFKKVKNIADNHKLKIHIDGARIFNAAVALNTSVKKLTKNADSVSCCLSKGLSAPVGSLLLGSKNFILKAKRLRKALGGGMRQSGILAAAGIYSFNNMVDRLQEDHYNAKLLASELSEIDELKINLNNVHTNIIFFYLNNTNLKDDKFILELLHNNIKIDSKGNRKFRMVTHSNFKKNDVAFVVNKIKSIIR